MLPIIFPITFLTNRQKVNIFHGNSNGQWAVIFEELDLAYLQNINLTILTGCIPVEYSINMLQNLPLTFDFSTVYRQSIAFTNTTLNMICNSNSPFQLSYVVIGY